MIDVSAENGWLATTLRIQNIMQMVVQGRWVNESPFLVLPHIEPHMLYAFRKKGLHAIPQLWDLCQKQCEPLAKILRPEMDENMIDVVFEALQKLPKLHVELSIAFGDRPPFALPKRSGSQQKISNL